MFLKTTRTFLLPRSCALCGVRTERRYLCYFCLPNQSLSFDQYCRPQNNQELIREEHFIWIYQGNCKQVIRQAKTAGENGLRKYLTEQTATYWRAQGTVCYDLVIPIPPERADMLTRGFHLPDDLALAISRKKTRFSVLQNTGRKKNKQKDLGFIDRFKNVADAFHTKKGLGGQRVLLVDDVHTSGATALAAASVLRAAGASQVDFFGLAINL